MIEYYNEAFKKDPSHPKAEDAYANMGKAYENKLDFNSAYKMYTLYLQRFPNGKYKNQMQKAADRMELQGGAR